jgi:hypothetical protein
MMRKILVLLLIVAGAVAAYTWRPEVRDAVDSVRSRWSVLRKEPTDTAGTGEANAKASAEVAAAAKLKIERLGAGTVDAASFSDDELQSLLEFEYRQLLPAFVDSPRVNLDGDHLRLRLRIPVERLPRVSGLGEIVGLLPDTTDLDVRGTLLPADDRHVAFAVDGVSAEHIPLPKRLVAPALEALGRVDRPNLPADAIALPLPKGVRAAYVRGDSLVLLASAARRTGN